MSKLKSKKLTQFLQDLNFLDTKSKETVIDDYLMTCNLKHTIQIIRWNGINNKDMHFESLQKSIG